MTNTLNHPLNHIPQSWNCEQIHTSILNLVFQQAKVAGVRELVKMKIRNLQSSLVCSIILWKSSLQKVEWISGWRSWLASGIQNCVWRLAFTRFMRWCMFWHIGNPKSEPSRITCWRRRGWFCKKVSRYTMCVQMLGGSLLRLGIPTENGLAFIPPGSRTNGKKTLLDW